MKLDSLKRNADDGDVFVGKIISWIAVILYACFIFVVCYILGLQLNAITIILFLVLLFVFRKLSRNDLVDELHDAKWEINRLQKMIVTMKEKEENHNGFSEENPNLVEKIEQEK